jgi:hypothetical protein
MRFLKAGVFAAALLSVGGLVGIAVTGIERVNLGPARKRWHSAWMVEFHWPALVLFATLLVLAIAAALWLCRAQARERIPK